MKYNSLWRGTYLGVTVTVTAKDEYEAKQRTFEKVIEQFKDGTKTSTNSTEYT